MKTETQYKEIPFPLSRTIHIHGPEDISRAYELTIDLNLLKRQMSCWESNNPPTPIDTSTQI